MAETLDAQLTRVQAAIAGVETKGQTFNIDGVTYSRANLKTLYEREKRLLALVAAESAGSGGDRRVAEF